MTAIFPLGSLECRKFDLIFGHKIVFGFPGIPLSESFIIIDVCISFDSPCYGINDVLHSFQFRCVRVWNLFLDDNVNASDPSAFRPVESFQSTLYFYCFRPSVSSDFYFVSVLHFQ